MAVPNFTIDLSDYNDQYIENLENSVEYAYETTVESLAIPCGTVDVESAPGAPGLPGTCPVGKTAGDTLNMLATAISGVAPYNVKFYKDVIGTVLIPNRVQIGVISTPAGITIAADGGTASDTYVLTDLDVASANFDGTAGVIQLISTVTDSCPGSALTCERVCIMTVACPAPTCSFVVT